MTIFMMVNRFVMMILMDKLFNMLWPLVMKNRPIVVLAIRKGVLRLFIIIWPFVVNNRSIVVLTIEIGGLMMDWLFNNIV